MYTKVDIKVDINIKVNNVRLDICDAWITQVVEYEIHNVKVVSSNHVLCSGSMGPFTHPAVKRISGIWIRLASYPV